MARVRRTFTPEFKRDAVRLVVTEGKTVSEVARNLGIVRSLLQRWVEQHADQDADGNPRKARGAESAETKALRKQLRDVTEERDILKKALVDSIGERNIIRSVSTKGDVVNGSDGTTRAVRATEGGGMAAMEGRSVA
jgi:transposase